MPSPTSEFLISTNVPALARSRSRAFGTEVGERPHRHAVPELGAVEVGVHDPRLVADRRVDQGRERPDRAALADAGAAAQERARLDHGVAADLDAGVDQRALRIHDRHAGERELALDAGLGQRTHVGELDAAVDAERERRVRDDVRGDQLAVGAQERQHVGQVELALGVVGGEPPERLDEVAARERVDARVDLADRLLLGGRVARRLRLDDALDAAVGRADHAPVARRVLELHRRHRRRRAALLVCVGERGDRLGGDQRHVAVEHEHGVVGADVARGRAHRVAGPVGLLLHRELHAVGERTLEPPLRPVDHHDPPGPGLLRGVDRPADDRPPADRVQDLRRVGLHTRALARGEDQHGGSGHAIIVVSGRRSTPLGGGLLARHAVFGTADGPGSIPGPPVCSGRSANIRSCQVLPTGSQSRSFERRSRHRSTTPRRFVTSGSCDQRGKPSDTSEVRASSGTSPSRTSIPTSRALPRYGGLPPRFVEILVEGSTYQPSGTLKEAPLRRTGLKERRCELCGQGEELARGRDGS